VSRKTQTRKPGAWEKFVRHPIFPYILLLVITIAAYLPALHAGFIWDDDDYVTRNSTLHDLHGLFRIWFEVGVVPQYYPLVHTSFWLENHLWGLDPFYFHLDNILLHALAAILLWRILKWLQVPGSWLAAAIFALHPVCVESVAWITERKNVLSAVFYFTSALAYFRFLAARFPALAPSLHAALLQKPMLNPWFWYFLSLLLFLCALWSKTVTCSLPAALLLVIWWKLKPSALALSQPSPTASFFLGNTVLPLLPFFALGAGLGFLTVWLEKNHVGAQGTAFAFTFFQRCLIAGRALWFYAAKLLWPWPLTFIYPRWNVSTAIWWQWLFLLAALTTIGTLWLGRSRFGKGPLVAVLFFSGTLFPALGFVNVYPMRFSFVADHFQYLASVGLISLAAAGLFRLGQRLGTTPGAPPYQGTATLVPAVLLLILAVLTWNQSGMYIDHETLWRVTLSRNPNSFIVHNNLGNLLLRRGLVDDAIEHFRKVIELEPTYEIAYYNYGNALLQKGQPDLAIAQYRKAIDLAPRYVGPHNNLGNVLLDKGQEREAVAQYEIALRLDPKSPILYNNLAKVLATSSNSSLRNGKKALEFAQRADKLSDGNNPLFVATLGAAYAECGQYQAASATAQRALELAYRNNEVGLAQVIAQQLQLYQSGHPFRQPPPG
jgi:tetratricopeptide (TPR) repeat protein